MIEVTEVHLVLVEALHVTVLETVDTQVVFIGEQGPQGPPGPQGSPGANGLGAISADPGNAITTGTDGGLYCPAVTTATTDW